MLFSPFCQPLYSTYLKCLFHPPESPIFIISLFSTYPNSLFHPPISPMFTISLFLLSPFSQPLCPTYLKCLFHPPVSSIFILSSMLLSPHSKLIYRHFSIASFTLQSAHPSTFVQYSFQLYVNPLFWTKCLSMDLW